MAWLDGVCFRRRCTRWNNLARQIHHPGLWVIISTRCLVACQTSKSVLSRGASLSSGPESQMQIGKKDSWSCSQQTMTGSAYPQVVHLHLSLVIHCQFGVVHDIQDHNQPADRELHANRKTRSSSSILPFPLPIHAHVITTRMKPTLKPAPTKL